MYGYPNFLQCTVHGLLLKNEIQERVTKRATGLRSWKTIKMQTMRESQRQKRTEREREKELPNHDDLDMRM